MNDRGARRSARPTNGVGRLNGEAQPGLSARVLSCHMRATLTGLLACAEASAPQPPAVLDFENAHVNGENIQTSTTARCRWWHEQKAVEGLRDSYRCITA
jgi:hypothetical protein